MKNIPIFFTFDNNYVVPAAVSFYSLLSKAKENIFYEMFVLHSDIKPENQKLLNSVIKRFKNAKLSFIDTGNFLKKEWENGNFEENNKYTKFTSDAIVRCFAAQFFPQYDKIIYSDVDVVFVQDISELWDIDLQDKYIAAVKNPFMKFSKIELSHLKPEHYEKLKDSYFAGGIWVLNLKQIRKDNLEQKMWEVLQDETIIKRWNDQDIMNIACNNQVIYLPLNYIGYPYMQDLLKLPDFTSHYTKAELWDSVINKKIIHFADRKPWNDSVRYKDLWYAIFEYLDLPKTAIFKEYKEVLKYKKYKKMSVLLGFIIVILLIIIIKSFL